MPLLFFLLLLPLLATASPAPVTVLTIDGAVSPASADYFARGLKRATENGSTLVVLKMDTPGGLDTAMRDIIKGILASPIPVATVCLSERCARSERRHLHPLCQSHRGDGAGHQSRRGNAGEHRHRRTAKRTGAGACAQGRRFKQQRERAGQGQAFVVSAAKHDESKADPRRLGVHPQPCPNARAQC
jgi:hypothetical protein